MHKGEDPATMSNYPPIFLISNIAKILEDIMKSRLTNFLAKMAYWQINNLVSEKEHTRCDCESDRASLLHIFFFVYLSCIKQKPGVCTGKHQDKQ